jgi:glycosyltransferase involved in cell wall biosynthesis
MTGPIPRVSIVTTCKGRLHHLRRSLPSFLAQVDSEVIVVDYDCPDGTAGVCARDFPAARVVKVEDAPRFNWSHARNLGAAAAQGEWIAFFDADMVMAPDLVRRLGTALDMRGRYHRFVPIDIRTQPTCGSCVVRREDYVAVDRYDDVVQGYGGEDQDLYFRLELSGVKPQKIDFDMLAEIIQHHDKERVRFGVYPTVLRHQQANDVYYLVKHSLMRHVGIDGLPVSQRQTLYGLVRDVVEDASRSPESPIHFTVELPRDPIGMWTVGWTFKRHLVFDLTPNLNEIKIRIGQEGID